MRFINSKGKPTNEQESQRSVVIDYIRTYLTEKGITDSSRQDYLVSKIEALVSRNPDSLMSSQISRQQSNLRASREPKETRVASQVRSNQNPQSSQNAGLSGLPQITNLEEILKRLVRQEVSKHREESNDQNENGNLKDKNNSKEKRTFTPIRKPYVQTVYRPPIRVYRADPARFNEYAMSPTVHKPQTPTTAPSQRQNAGSEIFSTRNESPNYLKRRVLSRKRIKPVVFSSNANRSRSIEPNQQTSFRNREIKNNINNNYIRERVPSRPIHVVQSRIIKRPVVVTKMTKPKVTSNQSKTSQIAANKEEERILNRISKGEHFSSRADLKHLNPKIMKRSRSRGVGAHREIKRSIHLIKPSNGPLERHTKIEYSPLLVRDSSQGKEIKQSKAKVVRRVSSKPSGLTHRPSRFASQKIRKSNSVVKSLRSKTSQYLRQSENHLVSMD